MKGPVSLATDQVSDQARFAAREFVAYFEREMGADVGAVVRDRMLFAYEMGYLRGHREGLRAAGEIFDSVQATTHDTNDKEK